MVLVIANNVVFPQFPARLRRLKELYNATTEIMDDPGPTLRSLSR